jgi:hypothetical protein
VPFRQTFQGGFRRTFPGTFLRTSGPLRYVVALELTLVPVNELKAFILTGDDPGLLKISECIQELKLRLPDAPGKLIQGKGNETVFVLFGSDGEEIDEHPELAVVHLCDLRVIDDFGIQSQPAQ